jgi:hypothetical protein
MPIQRTTVFRKTNTVAGAEGSSIARAASSASTAAAEIRNSPRPMRPRGSKSTVARRAGIDIADVLQDPA